ncbi:hypothetical protein B0H14DRAFT_261906 [Mycena olivaceomarginata]|nr:hypothetical protein B0H14DRAFT_261906 [Mycena olivaceomarginata]
MMIHSLLLLLLLFGTKPDLRPLKTPSGSHPLTLAHLLGSVRPIDASGGSAVIRGSSPVMKSLEPMAIEWLKGARAKLMSDLEAEYHTLEQSLNNPLLRPHWAVDPAQSLLLVTGHARLPPVLALYAQAIGNNILAMLHACGFEHVRGP